MTVFWREGRPSTLAVARENSARMHAENTPLLSDFANASPEERRAAVVRALEQLHPAATTAQFSPAGQIGYINPSTGTIREVYLNEPLHTRGVTFDSAGNLWLAASITEPARSARSCTKVVSSECSKKEARRLTLTELLFPVPFFSTRR